MTTKVSDKYRITLPSMARRKLHIAVGDQVEVVVRNDGILLKPKKMVDSSQAYFWTKEWQEKERQADADFVKGRFQTAEGLEEFFHKLHRRKSHS
jgi:AbrB family looped-hinge helix DNA binding protein